MMKLKRLCIPFSLLLLTSACGSGAPRSGPDPDKTVDTPMDDPSGQNKTPENPRENPTEKAKDNSSSTGSATPENTFEHQELEIDPFDVLSRIQEEGPPEVSARIHACMKPKYSTIRNILASLGVNMNGGDGSAGALFRLSDQVLGGPNYQARVREGLRWTTAGATRLFDIFVLAAPEIIAAMPNTDHCKLNGQPTRMFDDAGQCTIAGIACLQGSRASQAQKDTCDRAILDASTPEKGRIVAVASILSAAHTCE